MRGRTPAAVLLGVLLAGCEQAQSVISPAGDQASWLFSLLGLMVWIWRSHVPAGARVLLAWAIWRARRRLVGGGASEADRTERRLGSPWYAAYAQLGVQPFGLTPAEDQQVAGLLMWIPGGLVYAGAALALIGSALRSELREGRVADAR